jgi:DNA-binding transcriptional regulator YiaG
LTSTPSGITRQKKRLRKNNPTGNGWEKMEPTFAERLKQWRGGLRQKEAAEKLGLPLPTFRKWENGKRTPPKYVVSCMIEKMKNGD